MWTYDAENVSTKRGKVMRIVRERYLRDDIACGLAKCSQCESYAGNNGSGITLSRNPKQKQYLIPSMQLVLKQMDVLEHSKCEELSNIIILETVWEHVKAQELSVYNRLRALLKSDRHFVVFANDHHRDTYAAKNHGENSIERNIRASCEAYKWYQAHFKKECGIDAQITYLANDDLDAEEARQYGVQNVITIKSFLKPLETKHPELMDLLAAGVGSEGDKNTGKSNAPDSKAPRTFYKEHMGMSEVLAGIKNKRYFQGVIRCNRDHWLECNVLIHGLGDAKVPVLISGRENINRAMDGDVVAIELLPTSEWKKPSSAFAINDENDEDEISPDTNVDDEARVNEPDEV